jgi:hypothetical protein
MEECFFCNRININDFLLENELAVARLDDFPVNKRTFRNYSKKTCERLVGYNFRRKSCNISVIRRS